MSKEAMKLALEALAVKFSEGWHEGIKIDASDIMLLNDAAQALAEQPAQHDPSAGTQVSKVWWDGEKLMEKPIPLEDFYKPAQQEPVAWIYKPHVELLWPDEIEVKNPSKHRSYKPLYSSPPAQQGQAAWTLLLTGEHHGLVGKAGEKFVGHPEHYERVDVYTSPPAQRTWVGLTDEERKDIELGIEVFGASVEDVLKEAEAKLKEKNT